MHPVEQAPYTPEADDPPAPIPNPHATVAPLLHQPRESLLPALAAALSVHGATYTSAGSKADEVPTLHPLIADFLTQLPADQRERWAGRCPEPVLLSRHLAVAEQERGKRAARRSFTLPDARKALRGARLTTRMIRENGDPEHGTYQPPCRSCAALLAHLGVKAVQR